MISDRNFCISAWTEIRILSDGRLGWCHAGNFDYTVDKIQNTNLDEYFNGRYIDLVRQQYLLGKDLKECNNCYKADKKINFSARRRRNVQMAIFPGEHLQKSFAESPMPSLIAAPNIKPNFYNIVLGNLCNLGCVMCSEEYSSRLAVDFKKINIQRDITSSALLDWTKDDVVWLKFLKQVESNENLLCLHVQGGEPFIHHRFYELIDHLIKIGRTDFHLTMVTNGTVYSPELFEKFSKFRSCQIEVSLETTTLVNDYIRYPSKTPDVVKNILLMLSHRSEQLNVIMRTVPQLLSVIEYESILEFCLEHSMIINSNLIENPEFLKSCVWPDKIIAAVVERLERFKQGLVPGLGVQNLNIRNTNKHSNLLQNIDLVLTGLREPLGNKLELQLQAKQYFKKIDGLRNLNILDYCPEFKFL